MDGSDSCEGDLSGCNAKTTMVTCVLRFYGAISEHTSDTTQVGCLTAVSPVYTYVSGAMTLVA